MSTDATKSSDAVDAKPFTGGPSLHPTHPTGSGDIMFTKDDFFADEYKMDFRHRGKALIINNKTFQHHLGLGERTGTDTDAVSLSQRLVDMAFNVEVFNDLTCKEMTQILLKAASDEEYNKNSDCFVCAILSHGEEGVVYGVDDKIETKTLLEFFKGNNCCSLLGKPKIFFIQACQGGKFDGGANVNTFDAKGTYGKDHEIQVHKIPSEADFLIAYSVVPGYFSWRNSANGSWFIQALSEVLEENWSKMDLLTMMTRVNKKVALNFESRTGKDFMNRKKQIPCITSMLTKEVWFKPKA